jgi:hypothetical protein
VLSTPVAARAGVVTESDRGELFDIPSFLFLLCLS